ncbi:MAG: hypothetical protein AAFP19_25225, partial [Bacteroidota bacterium]
DRIAISWWDETAGDDPFPSGEAIDLLRLRICPLEDVQLSEVFSLTQDRLLAEAYSMEAIQSAVWPYTSIQLSFKPTHWMDPDLAWARCHMVFMKNNIP